MVKKSEEVFTVEVDAATKKRIESLLKQQKRIDREAANLTEEAQNLSNALPGLMNRKARRKAMRVLPKLRTRLENLKSERMEAVRELNNILERRATVCKE